MKVKAKQTISFLAFTMLFQTAALGADPAAERAAFAPCSACHSTESGKPGFGPSLWMVMGRKAGSVPGFAYSPAMKGSAVKWTPSNLDRYLRGPQQMIPGNRMPYPGLSDATKRALIISFLKKLK